MGYWKELPYRGQPEKKPPKPRKPRRTLSPKEKWRDNIIGTLRIFLILGIIFGLIFFNPTIPRDQSWKLVLYFLVVFSMMFGLGAGIDALNRYLRADDLDKPKAADENQEE